MSEPDHAPRETPPGARTQVIAAVSVDDEARLAERLRASMAHGDASGDDAQAAGADPIRAILGWTEDLDQDRATSLWSSLACADERPEREAAISTWVEWADVAVPAAVRLADLQSAAEAMLAELLAIATTPERLDGYDATDRRLLARALRGWVRGRVEDPGSVLGGVRAILRAEGLGGVEPVLPAERNVLASALRRNIERLPSYEAASLVVALAQLESHLPVFAPFTEAVLDFLLLEGESHVGFSTELAALAALPAWTNTVRLGLASAGRPSLRAARLLSALAAHPEVARVTPSTTAHAITQDLVAAVGHPRFAIWSRAARAMGRLVGVVPELAGALLQLLDPATPVTTRRRAHAALGCLGVGTPDALVARRDAVMTGAAEPWLIASISVGLIDNVQYDPAWEDVLRDFAARGGPESWAALLLPLREVAARYPVEAERARRLASEIRALAEAHPVSSPADAELVERALALAGRLVAPDGSPEVTSSSLLAELCARVAADPLDPSIAGAVEEFVAHTDGAVSAALRAISQDNPRTAARAGVILEEAVDLVVDGDLAVITERVTDGAARHEAAQHVEALRARLLRAVWTGLRRPTPATAPWRRWLLRSAAVLPRVAPAGVDGALAERVVREQVLDTLERVADDPSIQSPALQRYVLSAIEELADVLRPALGDGATLTVLTWMAVRGAALPSHTRARRMLDDVPVEKLDRLFLLAERLGRAAPATHKELEELAALAGDRCRLGAVLGGLARALAALAGRGPEAHWSGLPKLDLADIARAADDVRRARDDAAFALTLDAAREASAAGETLAERAARLNRSLTTVSLKFVDAARRAEVVEHYVADVAALAEEIASAAGPVAGAPVRAQLARSQVQVRAMSAEVARDREEKVRYIARLKVLGSLASAHEGGMASTYLAEGPAPGKRVVVKLLPWERFAGVTADVARTLFEKEMQRLAPITHPNVVSIVDAGFVDEGAYIALEFIPGASLETALRTFGPVDLWRLGPIIEDAARGLVHLHARGIIHRDVKPANIMLQFDREDELTRDAWESAEFVRSVLIDLGIASDHAGSRTDAPDDGVVGTPGYLAPEIARGLDVVTPAIDVYALAVVVFEALTGVNPYLEDGAELTEILIRHGTTPLPLERLPDEAQLPGVLHLLAESSKLDPRARPTMREFLDRWIAALIA